MGARVGYSSEEGESCISRCRKEFEFFLKQSTNNAMKELASLERKERKSGFSDMEKDYDHIS